nr:MAG TPA: hypothetical protein [Caudoviricetes sp.]DAY70430.1 MAG TPA: hypothetical protein [Caudoviricetes sp.]
MSCKNSCVTLPRLLDLLPIVPYNHLCGNIQNMCGNNQHIGV